MWEGVLALVVMDWNDAKNQQLSSNVRDRSMVWQTNFDFQGNLYGFFAVATLLVLSRQCYDRGFCGLYPNNVTWICAGVMICCAYMTCSSCGGEVRTLVKGRTRRPDTAPLPS